MRWWCWSALALTVACGGDKDSADEHGGGDDSGADDSAADDSGTDDSGASALPDDPTPFTLSVSGAYEGDLSFDAPTCTWSEGAPNFRAFWRNSAGDHVFVLIADVLGCFEGPGAYDQSMATVRVKLQEEAGGSGTYFATDTAQGDTTTVTVESVDANAAWGEIEFSAMHASDGGEITASPQPVPIWCPTMN